MADGTGGQEFGGGCDELGQVEGRRRKTESGERYRGREK